MKRWMSIAALLAFLWATGCANVSLPPDVSEKNTSDRLEEIASSLPQTEEFRGDALTILTQEAETILGDEEAAGTVRGALKNRNSLIAASYEMEVSVRAVGEDEILELLQESAVAGVAVGDILCYSAETSAALWAEGLLQNLEKLPYFASSHACFDTNAAMRLQIGSGLYLLPDPSAQSYDNTYILFYDRKLVRDAGLPLPEEAVKAGNWTLALFQQYAETVAASVMDRTSYDLKTDVFGYSSPDNANLLPYLLWCGLGDALFCRQEDGSIDLAYDDADSLFERIDPLHAIYDSASRHPLDGEEAFEAFLDGRLGFLFARLEEIKSLYLDPEREYGILPLPRQDETQEGYYCPVDVTGRVLSVPAQTDDAARSGLGLTAICAAGGALLHEAEVQTYITLYALDNDQTCMLETILDSTVFDFGWVYGTQNSSVRGLSSGMLFDVLVDNMRFSNILEEHLEAFRLYAQENFA